MKQDTVNFNIKSIKRMKSCSVAFDFITEHVSINSLADIYSTAFSLSLKSFTLPFLFHILSLLPSAQSISLSFRSRLYVNAPRLHVKVHEFYLFFSEAVYRVCLCLITNES